MSKRKTPNNSTQEESWGDRMDRIMNVTPEQWAEVIRRKKEKEAAKNPRNFIPNQ